MKQPMTAAELFKKIHASLKEKGKIPDILDYELAGHSLKKLTTYEFDLRSNLEYGASEGIYLSLWIERYTDDNKESLVLGTYKTLRRDEESMHIMARLLADFIIEEDSYVNSHLDDFTWEGSEIYIYDESGQKLAWGYSCSSMARALEKKDKLLKKYPKIVIRDNASRMEAAYSKEN